jgi:hypothetical protein
MNTRERLLAMILLGGVSLGGLAALYYHFLLGPLQERDASIAALTSENDQKRDRIAQILAERPKLDWWRRLSLPTNSDTVSIEYDKYLSNLLDQSGFARLSYTVTPRPVDAKSSPTIPGKGPVYTKLTFHIMADGSLSALIEFLKGFYRTGLMQQIRTLQVQRPLTTGPQESAQNLTMNLTIEALMVSGAEKREQLFARGNTRLAALDVAAGLCQAPTYLAQGLWNVVGPSGPLGRRALAEPQRTYAAIAGKDVFFGDAPVMASGRPQEDVDVTRFVYLTDITQEERRTQAWLYDRYNNHWTRLRASAGFDSFQCPAAVDNPTVRGRVVRIDNREVIFKVEDNYYTLHVGQSLEESMRKALSASQVKDLKLTTVMYQ